MSAYKGNYLYIDNLGPEAHPVKHLKVFNVQRIGSWGEDAIYAVKTTLDEDFSDVIDESLYIENHLVIISREILSDWYERKLPDLEGVETAFYRWGGLLE